MAYRKLTPDVKDRILQAIRLGATYDLACKYAGVSRRTLLTYRRDRAFCAEVEKAEGQAVVGWLAKIEKAASDGEWTAAAWKLERRYPHVYGRRVQEVDARVVHEIPLAFDYAAAAAELVAPALAAGPNGHRPPPGAPQVPGDGPPLGEDPDGG
jgi:transposase